MTELFRRLRYLIHRRRFDRELASEMELHREMAGSGARDFGNPLLLREEARDAWGWTWIDRLGQDLRYAGRMLRRSPGFTAAAILMLAIGIGVNVAVFGFFDLLVLRPLHVQEPGTLLRFHRRSPQAYAFTLPYPEMAFFRDHSRTLSAVLALNATKVAMEGEAKQINAHFVSANFFKELGARARLGRLLDPARDERASAESVVVLSQGFWERHFGANPLIAGAVVHLNGKPASVIGVAPRDFSGLSLDVPDVWAPLTQQPRFVKGSRLLTDPSVESSGVQVWGRLRQGAGPRVAEEELRALAVQLRQTYPADIWEHESLPSEPGGYATGMMIGTRRGTGTEGRDEMYPIFGLVSALGLLILAVACGNLGSLLLARGVARDREISIRIAIGAGRSRLIRQLFTESLLLAALGSLAGLFLGSVVLRGLITLAGGPAWLNAAPDGRVIAFGMVTGFMSAILFGLTPAWQVVRQRHRATTVRHLLVGSQVAASCVLLIVAGLLVRALEHAMSSDPGFQYEHVITINPNLATNGYTAAQARVYLDALKERARALPGVESVSLAMSPPLGSRRETTGIELAGRALDVQINRVDPQFFGTMKIPILRGRNLRASVAHEIIVSQSLARHWPTGDPLGKMFSMGANYTVVGVAGTARIVAMENSDSVEVYVLAESADAPLMVMLVNTIAPPEGLARPLAALAKTLDPGVFPEVQLLKGAFRAKLQVTEYSALAVSLLGFVAQLLACLGIVGVVAYSVSQRTKEIGIRIALGAKPADILSVVLRQFSYPVTTGLLVGVAGAMALSHILRRVLYGVSNLDPVAYLGAIGFFVITVAVAAGLPARRALGVNPLRALRYE